MNDRCSLLLRYLALPLLLALCGIAPARAFPSPETPCPLPGKDSESFITLDQISPRILQELQRRFKNPGDGIDMAPRDNEWQETDATDTSKPPLSFRRFIQAGHEGARWYVWYEMGGIGHSYQIAIFDLSEAAGAPRLVIHSFVDQPDKLCTQTKAHLHDASATPEEGYIW
jgi:hypothetical protein